MLPWLALAALMIGSVFVVLWAGRDTVFRGDDWDLLLYRQGFSSGVFFYPHNEHLVALQVVELKLIGAVAGLHYVAYRAALALVDMSVALLFFVFARKRVGNWLALAATTPLLFLGAASDSLIWPTMLGAMSSLTCGIGVLLLLDRNGVGAKLGACALLAAAVGFESNGLFFLVAAVIWLVLSRRWRDLWIAAIPAAAYLAWYADYGASQFTRQNLAHAPGFIFDSAVGGVSALIGVGFSTGHPKVVGGLGLLALAVGSGALLWRSRPRLEARTAAIALLPVVSWAVIALGRANGGDPFASRYVYASVLFILMALTELVRDTEVRQFFKGWPAMGLLALLTVSVVANVHLLSHAGDYQRLVSQYVRGRTGAIELARRTIDPNLVLGPLPDMGNMRAGWYLNVVDRFGESPIGRPALAGLIEQGQEAGDQVLAVADPARFSPARTFRAQGPPPRVDYASAALRERGPCLDTGSPSATEILVPQDGLLIRPDPGTRTRILLRRYASTYAAAPRRTVNGSTLLTIGPDHSRVPWRARIVSSGRIELCGTHVTKRRLIGAPKPPSGDQGCEPFNLGTRECRFRRY